jgi:hypothetical protein
MTRKEIMSNEITTIDDIIDAHLKSMRDEDLNYDAYHQMIADLDRLAAAKERIAPAKRPISKDAIIGAAASIAGILVIVAAEHATPLLSKAFSFVPKILR